MVIDLMIAADHQNLSLKLKDLKSIADNLVKNLVIGKCRYAEVPPLAVYDFSFSITFCNVCSDSFPGKGRDRH